MSTPAILSPGQADLREKFCRAFANAGMERLAREGYIQRPAIQIDTLRRKPRTTQTYTPTHTPPPA